MNTCSRFGISMKQIYTVTVDNAANMLKTVRILSDEDEQNNIEDSSDDSADIITESEVIEVLLNQEARDICLDDIETSEFLNETDFTITAIRCAAHTLQLAICDFLKKKKEVSQIVEKARQIVRKLRTPLLKSTLSAMYGKNAILDCTTRWHSTLDMLERLFELKTYCEQIEDTDLKLSEIMWSKISALIEVLTPARVATKRLQSEQLLLGDLYEIWQRCIIETGKKDNEFATDVVTNMKNRQSKLLENEVIVSGIYMDPRYNVILTEPMIRVAKNCLLRTYSRMQSILSNVSNTEHNAVSNDVSDVSEEEEFEKLLKDAEATHACNKSLTQRSQCHIENEMDEYFKEPRLKSSSNILTYWNAKKNKMPELYELAQVILAVPPTQVSVERLFSGLKFILSPHRSKMNSDVIDNILLIRLNMQKLGGEKDANA